MRWRAIMIDANFYKNIIKLAFPRGFFWKAPAEIQTAQLIEALQFARTELADNNLQHIVSWAYKKGN